MENKKEDKSNQTDVNESFRNLVFYAWSQTEQLERDFRRVIVNNIGRKIGKEDEERLDAFIAALDSAKEAMSNETLKSILARLIKSEVEKTV
jgi:hypothetical protein